MPSPGYEGLRAAPGNVPQELRDGVAAWWLEGETDRFFARDILETMKTVEMVFFETPEDPRKVQARAAFEFDVTVDMCNVNKSMHGGCTAMLIDMSTSILLNLLARRVRPENTWSVSLALNTTYHAPAPLGSRIKIVGTSVAVGGRTLTAKAEVWDITNGRLVATGTHIKMPPSLPKL